MELFLNFDHSAALCKKQGSDVPIYVQNTNMHAAGGWNLEETEAGRGEKVTADRPGISPRGSDRRSARPVMICFRPPGSHRKRQAGRFVACAGFGARFQSLQRRLLRDVASAPLSLSVFLSLKLVSSSM
ncbi:hypothetical protein KSP39_PZI011018 [Platanthera zijinensis]|uniref:Uncharacterized protein n=1 Tax=Platanthera zijinensis TaxID=2320716 RepID=A0AAP0BGH4_9ASPA